MKIWIDLTNSPHINFFLDIIRELNLDDDVLLTCRPLANTIDLIELFNLESKVIGKHYGKNIYRKIFGYLYRVIQLYKQLKDEELNVAVSHSSFYSPAVAKLLKIPSIYLNDNEHAKGNYFAFLFSNLILVPEFIDISKMITIKNKRLKVHKYPGVKEGVYLWRMENEAAEARKSKKSGKKAIYIRPEPWTAQYYKGSRDFLDDLIIELKDRYNIVILPRGDEQKEHYQSFVYDGIKLPSTTLKLNEILKKCDLFIGAGGTMTREMAVLGIPTISIYQDTLLEVDEYLIRTECMVHHRELSANDVDRYLKNKMLQPPNKILLEKGKEAYFQIVDTIKKVARGEINA